VDYSQFFLIRESKLDNEVNSPYQVLDSKIPAEFSISMSISSTTVEKNLQRYGYYSFSLLDGKHYVSYPFVDISGKSTYLSRALVSMDYLGCFSEGANLNMLSFLQIINYDCRSSWRLGEIANCQLVTIVVCTVP
jgi:hypothetical protein